MAKRTTGPGDRAAAYGDPGYLEPNPEAGPLRTDRAGHQATIGGREHLDPIGHATPAANTFGSAARPTEEASGEINPGGLDEFPRQPNVTHGAKQKREGQRANRG